MASSLSTKSRLLSLNECEIENFRVQTTYFFAVGNVKRKILVAFSGLNTMS